jgi:hypothetical protein
MKARYALQTPAEKGTMRLFLSIAIGVLISSESPGQNYDTNNVTVETFAGSGFQGYLDGQGTQTMFSNPGQIVADPSGNLFVLDGGRIRKITPSGLVSSFVGGGLGTIPGYGTNVSLGSGSGGPLTMDHSNVMWVPAAGTAFLRIGLDGFVSYASNFTGVSSENIGGMCFDSSNNLYVSDLSANKIMRFRTNGLLETFAGSGNSGSIDGNGIFTSFNVPKTLAADSADNIYVWDTFNFVVRRINQNRDVVTITGPTDIDMDGSGTNASFHGGTVSAMCFDPSSGKVLVATFSSIREMAPDTNLLTLAGAFFPQTGYANGPGSLARFFGPSGVCVSQSAVFVSDTQNHRIRIITLNSAPQLVLQANLSLAIYPGLDITGTIGRTYRIESSIDMNNWVSEATILLRSSPYRWFDQNPVGQQKFYRAFLLP